MYGRPSGVSITWPDQRWVSSTPGMSARELFFEPAIARLRIRLLAGLVIFSAEDHQVVVSVRLDAEVV